MEQTIVVLVSFLVFFGLFFHCHWVLKKQGTHAATATSIRYRYKAMGVVFILVVAFCGLWHPDTFWFEASAALSASTLYFAGRFGALRFFSFIALVGVAAFPIALGETFHAVGTAVFAGAGLSFFVDLMWNRELKKRGLPPTDPPGTI